MIHTVCECLGTQKTLEGDTYVSFIVPDEYAEKLDELSDIKTVLDVKKFNEKRSLNANAYFWTLVDDIATVLHSTKDIIYLMLLREAGVWSDVEVIKTAVPILESNFRDIEILDEDDTRAYVRCYVGSSKYDKAQMNKLINEAVFKAQELGIDTWSRDEIERLVEQWNPYQK